MNFSLQVYYGEITYTLYTENHKSWIVLNKTNKQIQEKQIEKPNNRIEISVPKFCKVPPSFFI